MKIATIIVHRNTPDLVDRQVKQVNGMVENNHIIVVDAGSDQDKRTKYPSYWYPDKDFRGKCYAHNVGLKLLRGTKYDYYWFNHPDLDFKADPNCLKKLLGVMEKNPEIGVLSPNHSGKYPGKDITTPKGWHKVSTCDYLSLLIRRECIEKIGFLNPIFKYCRGAIHEYSYFTYKTGWCVAYCENAHVRHLGGTTYGIPGTKTISRKEYLKRAKIFSATYFVDTYGETWDKEFSKILPEEVKVNTYRIHRNMWEGGRHPKRVPSRKVGVD